MSDNKLSTQPTRIGTVINAGPNILAVLEQLGLLQEIKAASVPCPALHFYNTDMDNIGVTDQSSHKQLYVVVIYVLRLTCNHTCPTLTMNLLFFRYGYNNLLLARPRLHNILLKRIPPNRISFGKRVLRTEEQCGKVSIFCSDGTSYEGDILVGADGASSSVRQSLYKRMEEKGRLPKSDTEKSIATYVSVVGVANIADTEKFPQTTDPFSHFSQVVGKDSRSVSLLHCHTT